MRPLIVHIWQNSIRLKVCQPSYCFDSLPSYCCNQSEKRHYAELLQSKHESFPHVTLRVLPSFWR